MKRVIAGVLLSMSISSMVCAGEEEAAWDGLIKSGRSKPEYGFVENKPALPNVLIYGDSISLDYTVRVREVLKEKANVYRLYRNGMDSGKAIPVMRRMQKVMGKYWTFKWDVIHFNVGLHDLKYGEGKQVRSTEDYKKELKKIIEYFKEIAPDAKIIFATTTPVPKGAAPRRVAGDAVKYNEAAFEVLKSYPEIGINDLYGLSKPMQSKWCKSPGDVHYNEAGSKAQGNMVASAILKCIIHD